jgi:hypothetical protein
MRRRHKRIDHNVGSADGVRYTLLPILALSLESHLKLIKRKEVKIDKKDRLSQGGNPKRR